MDKRDVPVAEFEHVLIDAAHGTLNPGERCNKSEGPRSVVLCTPAAMHVTLTCTRLERHKTIMVAET
jgi:hypothetical protein